MSIDDSDLIRHNLVVFRNGDNALQVLPPLVEYLPEAKLNLVIYYLRNDEVQEAYQLIKDMEPSIPQVCVECVGSYSLPVAVLHPLSSLCPPCDCVCVMSSPTGVHP